MSNPSVEIQKKTLTTFIYTFVENYSHWRQKKYLSFDSKKKLRVSFKYCTELICNEHALGMTTIEQSDGQ